MKLGLNLCVLLLPQSGAFTLSSSQSRQPTSVASATASNSIQDLVAPPKVDFDDAKPMYDDHVQNTYGRYPITMVKGDGCTLTDSTGKEYLDFVSGIATCALGHANKDLSDAISDQMKQVHHVSNLYYIPVQAALAKWICDNSVAEKVFFCNSGAEANEGAIKCARRNAHNNGNTKPVIITAHQSFHGRTLAAVTATAQPKYHVGFGYDGQMVPGFEYVTYNDSNELRALVESIENDPENGSVAAIMLEAIQGEGGIIPGEYEFFKTARELCDKHNALLMLDEVQVGMGRTGSLWGFQQLRDENGENPIEPDVFTSAKALGGGVPIGAMAARGAAATTFGPGDHASTYGGNPLACRAGLAVAEYMTKHNTLQNVQDRGAQLIAGLEKIAEKFPTLFSPKIRGRGLILGIECINDDLANAGKMVGAAMEEGLLLVPAGPNVARFVPPLIVTEEQVDQALAAFEKAATKIVAEAESAAP